MKKALGTCRGGIPAAALMLLVACTSDRFSSGEPDAGTSGPASDETASDDTASDDTASDDTASDDTASDAEGGDEPSGSAGSGVIPPGRGGAEDASAPDLADDGQGDDASGGACSDGECVQDDGNSDPKDAGLSVPGDVSDASLDPPEPPPGDDDGSGADSGDADSNANADAASSPDGSMTSRVDARAPVEASVPDAGLDAAVSLDEASDPFTCPAESERGPGEHCYYFSSEEVEWAQARELCIGRGQGWDLATPSQAEEDDWIIERLSDEAWIGASDAEETDVWRWVDDGTVFWVGKQDGEPHDGAYTNWWDSGPSDTDDIEQCARYTLREGAWYWADIPCGRDYLYVCEWAPSE